MLFSDYLCYLRVFDIYNTINHERDSIFDILYKNVNFFTILSFFDNIGIKIE